MRTEVRYYIITSFFIFAVGKKLWEYTGRCKVVAIAFLILGCLVIWILGGLVVGFIGLSLERWVIPWLGTIFRITPHPRLKMALAILVALVLMFVWTVGVALTGWWVSTYIPSSSALAAAAPVAGSPAAPADSGSGSGSGYVVPSPDTVASGPTPPSGYVWCWFGRQGRGQSVGFDVEYIIEIPADYRGTLELWAEINGSLDEWGNDSLKGCEPVRTWLDATQSFPRASWINLGGNYVCEDDTAGCGGQRWDMTSSTNIPLGYDWLILHGNEENIAVYYDANLTQVVPGVHIIRWIRTADFPY